MGELNDLASSDLSDVIVNINPVEFDGRYWTRGEPGTTKVEITNNTGSTLRNVQIELLCMDAARIFWPFEWGTWTIDELDPEAHAERSFVLLAAKQEGGYAQICGVAPRCVPGEHGVMQPAQLEGLRGCRGP